MTQRREYRWVVSDQKEKRGAEGPRMLAVADRLTGESKGLISVAVMMMAD